MKKMSKILALIAAGAFVFGGMFTSCKDSDDEEDNSPKVTSIALGDSVLDEDNIVDISVVKGANLSLEANSVIATFEDGSTKDVTSSATFHALAFTEAMMSDDYEPTEADIAAATKLTNGAAVNLDEGYYGVLASYSGVYAEEGFVLEVTAASSNEANITASATWDFASLAGTECKGVDATTAFTTADALAAASVNYTSFVDGLVKFSIQEDVAYAATTGSGNLTIKSLDQDNAPIQYNKYEATTAKGSGSAGCLQIKNDALVIADVQGPFTVEALYGSNANSAKTDRHAYIKVAGSQVVAGEDNVPVEAATITYSYTGTDVVDVVIGSTNLVRVFDVKITK